MILPLVLVLVGLGFVVAEVFFVSFGLLGLVALACFLGADILAFQESQAAGWAFVIGQVVLIPAVVRLAFVLLPKLPFGRLLLLDAPTRLAGRGVPDHAPLVGRQGRALTPLRPSGTVEVDGERLSVVAVGGMIPAGATVEVEEVVGSEVRVRAISVPAPERRF